VVAESRAPRPERRGDVRGEERRPFFICGENGDLVIARLSTEKYDEVSRTKLLDPVGTGLGRPIVWSHPAYALKCVFARNDQEIVYFSPAKE
jgi:outer membrane protein assembly factor BamB